MMCSMHMVVSLNLHHLKPFSSQEYSHLTRLMWRTIAGDFLSTTRSVFLANYVLTAAALTLLCHCDHHLSVQHCQHGATGTLSAKINVTKSQPTRICMIRKSTALTCPPATGEALTVP